MHIRRFHVSGDYMIRFSWRSLAFLGLHSIRHYMQFTCISLRPLNIGLLLFVEHETSPAWHTWHHTTKAWLHWCLLGRLFRGNSSYCSVPSARACRQKVPCLSSVVSLADVYRSRPPTDRAHPPSIVRLSLSRRGRAITIDCVAEIAVRRCARLFVPSVAAAVKPPRCRVYCDATASETVRPSRVHLSSLHALTVFCASCPVTSLISLRRSVCLPQAPLSIHSNMPSLPSPVTRGRCGAHHRRRTALISAITRAARWVAACC